MKYAVISRSLGRTDTSVRRKILRLKNRDVTVTDPLADTSRPEPPALGRATGNSGNVLNVRPGE